MALSRKHYVAIAGILKERIQLLKRQEERGYEDSDERVEEVCTLADEFTYYFQQDNPRFEKNRFMRAAGCWGVD